MMAGIKMLQKVKPSSLDFYLRRIEQIFPEFKRDEEVKQSDIAAYYRESFWGYSLFHSWAGAIHMAMSSDKTFSKNDYLRQSIEIGKLIEERQFTGPILPVLEVGCGRGFNLHYLATSFPELKFNGIDFSKEHVVVGKKDLRSKNNVEISFGDFHELSQFKDGQFSLVFAVETLCHAIDLDVVLRELFRVLEDGGVLVIFDGFREPIDGLSEDMTTAIRYTEKAMAVPAFFQVSDFEYNASGVGFSVVENVDRSHEIMPNLLRFSDLAKGYFKFTLLSKLILRFVPRGLVTNAVAGLLMAITVSEGAHSYRKIILGKP